MMQPIDMLLILGRCPRTPPLRRVSIFPGTRSEGSPFRAGPRLHPNRAPFEFYPTPPEATRALLSVERFVGSIWEPACGDGRIAREFEAAGYNVVATDIADYGYGQPGTDFLEQRIPRACNIVTNPPYGRGLADRFINQALRFCERTGGTVAMLLNIASLCHPDRHDSFITRPPLRIWALDDCVCYPNGNPAQATRHTYHHRYCWLVWVPDHTGPTSFGWLSTAPFKDGARRLPSTNDKKGRTHDRPRIHQLRRLHRTP